MTSGLNTPPVHWRRPSDCVALAADRAEAKRQRRNKGNLIAREDTKSMSPPEGCAYEVRKAPKKWCVWRKTWNGNDWPVVKLVAMRDTEQEAEAVVRELVGEGVEI